MALNKRFETYMEMLIQNNSNIQDKITHLQEKQKEYLNLINSLRNQDGVSGLFQVSSNQHNYQSSLEQKYLNEYNQCINELNELNGQKEESDKEMILLNQMKVEFEKNEKYFHAKEHIETAYRERSRSLLSEYLFSAKQAESFLLQDSRRSDMILKNLTKDILENIRQLSMWLDTKESIASLSNYSDFLICMGKFYQIISVDMDGEFPLLINIRNDDVQFNDKPISKIGRFFLYDLISAVYFFPKIILKTGTIIIENGVINVDVQWDSGSSDYWIVDAVMRYYIEDGENDCYLF